MSNRAAALWGCTGLSVGVHHYNDNNGIGAPFWQMAGLPVPNPQFNIVKYLISEKDARFVIVVNIESNFLPINNVLIGDILSVHLFLDGFHVSEFLWDTGILIRDRPARVAILASPVNPATSEVRIFKFTEPILSVDNHNNEPNPFLGTIQVVVSHARGHANTQGLPPMVNHTRPFPNNSTIPPPQTTPHVITYHRRAHHVAAPAGMTKTAIIGPLCRFTFKYGTRGFIEHLMGVRLILAGDRDHPGAAPAPVLSHPPPRQAVRDNYETSAARTGQNVPGDSALVNASNQIIDIMHNYTRYQAARAIRRAVIDGDMMYTNPPRGPPVAGSSNVARPQNRPASMAQPHHGGMGMGMGYQQGPPPVTGQPHRGHRAPPVAGPSVFHNQYHPAPMAQPPHGQMGHHQGPPPATTQPPNTGRTRAGEIDELRQFSDGVRYIRRPVTGYAGLPLTSASSNVTPAFTAINAGLPLPPASPNITPGFTAINAGLPLTSTSPSITPGFTSINTGSTVPSIGAGPGSGRLGPEGRRLLAAQRLRDAQTDDSQTSARDRGDPAGPASTATPQVGESSRRGATPLPESNVLARNVSVSIDGGVHVNRPVNGTRAARTQQSSAATSTTGRPVLPDGLHRSQENIMAMTSSNGTNSARSTVTSPDSAHAAASAGNVSIPVPATASAALASGSDDSDAPLAQTYARRGANRGAVAEGVTHGAPAGEGAANATKLDGQDGSTGTTTVPVNTTTESGSEGDHSPPHKKHKVNGGGSGGTTGDKDA